MTARLLLKRGLKRTAATAAIVGARVGLRPGGAYGCVLMYHRLADVSWSASSRDNWNVTPARFERHLTALAQSCECVPLLDMPGRVAGWKQGDRPLVSLTFDDGFAGVATHALPVLQRLRVPATVFVVTSCVGATTPMPFDRWGQEAVGQVPSGAWRPMDWTQVELLAASGLVTIGSHSHWHRDGRLLSMAECSDEARRSRDELHRRLGASHARTFAYPYGSLRLGHVSAAYMAAVKDAGYELAVSTELDVVRTSSDRWALPRVEANGVDSPSAILAKAAGALMPFAVTDRLRKAARS